MPGAILRAFHVLTHLILVITYDMGTVTVLMLSMKKLKPREVT